MESPTATCRDVTRPLCTPMRETLAKLAASQPEALAICDTTQPVGGGYFTFTYKQLHLAAERLAKRLGTGGLLPGDVVAVVGPRCAGFVVGIVAALLSKAVFLVVDANQPVPRLRQLIARAGARLAIVTDNVKCRAVAAALAVTTVDAFGTGAVSCRRSIASSQQTLPDGIAYIMFTSGSTGEPKGCLGTEQGLSNRCHWMATTFP